MFRISSCPRVNTSKKKKRQKRREKTFRWYYVMYRRENKTCEDNAVFPSPPPPPIFFSLPPLPLAISRSQERLYKVGWWTNQIIAPNYDILSDLSLFFLALTLLWRLFMCHKKSIYLSTGRISFSCAPGIDSRAFLYLKFKKNGIF